MKDSKGPPDRDHPEDVERSAAAAPEEEGGSPAGPEAAGPEAPPPEAGAVACDLCGNPMREQHCKLICDQCGYVRDCSDP